MSSPSEPDEIVSISTACWFLPSRMIEPLPKARSICDKAASSALVLSTEVPSTRRRLACVTARHPSDRSAARPQQRLRGTICARFVLQRKRNLFSLCSSHSVILKIHDRRFHDRRYRVPAGGIAACPARDRD